MRDVQLWPMRDDSEATDALVSLASLALSRDASAVASAVDHFDMSDATKKLLDVIGVEIFTPLMECADAVDDRIAEACACALVDACAEACGPRDMFVMALGALQSRVERAAKDLDGDDDDHDYAGHHEPSVRHRGWRLTGAICAGLATWLRRAKNPASLAPDAIPIVASLAALCGRCARFVAEAEGGRKGRDANRHRGTTAPRRRTAASASSSKSRATPCTANARGGTRSRTGCARWRWTRAACSGPRLAGDCARTRTTSGCCKGSGPSTTYCRLPISPQTTRLATRRASGWPATRRRAKASRVVRRRTSPPRSSRGVGSSRLRNKRRGRPSSTREARWATGARV